MSASDPFAPKTKQEVADHYQQKADEAQALADRFAAEVDNPSNDGVTGATSATVRVSSTPVVNVNG